MARAFWTGEISFGLVTVPVKAYSASQDKTPSFRMLHKECGSRVGAMRYCTKCARHVEWSEIGKGYEVALGEYALFTREELERLHIGDREATPREAASPPRAPAVRDVPRQRRSRATPKPARRARDPRGADAERRRLTELPVWIDPAASGGGIDVVEFVDPKEIDVAYVGKSYWIGPGGRSARGFELLREALEVTGRVALAKVQLRTRVHLGILRPRGKLFSLDTMRFADEMVPADDIALPAARVSDRELALATDLVDQLSVPFDPAKHADEYRFAVERAAQAKVERDEIAREGVPAPDPEKPGGTVIDLAAILARHLKPPKEGA